jgi:hypothetical protein
MSPPFFHEAHKADASSPSDVIWLFDATVWIWAYLKFSDVPFIDNDALGPPMVLGWTRPEWLDNWINSGVGRISMQGLRTGTALSLRSILSGASDRLSVMSWGLAMKYRQVVDELLQELDWENHPHPTL